MTSPCWQDTLWKFYKDEVFKSASTDSIFNFYRNEARELDCDGAARIRQQNLKNYLSSYSEPPRILLVGEAPGPWGMRFTGVPFTSERQLADGVVPFSGQKTSASDLPYAERSATVFWNVMAPHFPQFFVWGTVPFHPHRPGEPFSIRTPKPGEVRAYLSLADKVIRIIQPEQILAIGRVAQGALTQLSQRFIPIRHPSHGGATEFARGMNAAFRKLAGTR